MSETPVLHQLRFSHYNEKARWALDHKRVPHVRRSSLPVLHVFRALRLTGERTMPVLSLDGETIGDSARIIDALESRQPDRPLYPADPAERERALELQRFFDEEVGAHVRRVFFYWMLTDESRAVCDVNTRYSGGAARGAYRAAWPVTTAAMRKAMAIDKSGAERSLEKSIEGLDRLEAELGDGEYLVGESFSVADLTAAALYFPVVRPPEYQYAYPERRSPGFEEIRESVAGRPGFAWIAEMWRRHRGASAEVPA